MNLNKQIKEFLIGTLLVDTEGKKIIPQNIADHLTTRSLAFWIMDDGQQVKRGGVTLCTDSYNTGEISILREALKKNFNLETSIHNKKGANDAIYERIYIKKDDLENIKPSLKSHMHESMLYKINENQSEIQNAIKQDSSDIENDGTDILDIFDIGGS